MGFPNATSDRRMQALQILNTLCTLPMEKNEYISVNVSLFCNLHYIQISLTSPSPHPPKSPLIRRILLRVHLQYQPSSLWDPSASFLTSAIRKYKSGCKITRCDSVRAYINYHTLCRGVKSPNAAVHRLNTHLILEGDLNFNLKACFFSVVKFIFTA